MASSMIVFEATEGYRYDKKCHAASGYDNQAVDLGCARYRGGWPMQMNEKLSSSMQTSLVLSDRVYDLELGSDDRLDKAYLNQLFANAIIWSSIWIFVFLAIKRIYAHFRH